MNFVLWLAGVMAVIMGCRFIIVLFKRIGSKENLNAVIDRAERGAAAAAGKVGDYMKKKKGGDNKPVVTIH